MAKIKERGKTGAAKNYITRNQALKKLQCSLSDFRRLCILKGIFPRVPKSSKRANKGSTAPASFYYAKDIQYLLHEPVLGKLREHKTFAKKLSRAVGRGEWALAKGLEERRPVYKLDHILKERYPTFPTAVRDLPDALSLVSLFSLLPVNPTPTSNLPKDLSANCARLMAEWKLYIIRSRALRKVFFSIKGVYYQVEVAGETVTWLEAYGFTQHVPTDVDIRILMTFLELHQTLLGFVLFKLYSDINLVYPPPLDEAKEAAGAGFDSFVLTQKKEDADAADAASKGAAADAKVKVTKKDVKKGIRSVTAAAMDVDAEAEPVASSSKTAAAAAEDEQDLDEFVEQPSKSDPASAALPTLSQLATSSAATSALTSLFAPYKIWISRSVPRQTTEFILRSFGCAQVGWDTRTMGDGADFASANDEGVTHVIVDRPAGSDGSFVFEEAGPLPAGRDETRTFVQPQWIVDSLNDGRLKPAGDYAPGGVLPPHLSPFGKEAGSYASDSRNAGVAADDEGADAEMADAVSDSDDDDDEDEDDETPVASTSAVPPALLASALDPANELLRRAAELEAEQTATPFDAFEQQLAAETRKARKSGASKEKARNAGKADEDEDLRRIMMSNKQKKLLEKMEYSNKEKTNEQANLERKRLLLQKQAAKKDKAAQRAGSAQKGKKSRV